jgi:dolichyl-phosphate beta-glucosyltransferase
VLSIVIPAYNERERLPTTLNSYIEYLDGKGVFDYELIVVDDGSTDGTSERVNQDFSGKVRVLIQPKNMGKGAALRVGVVASTGEIVLLCDADGSTPIEELHKLMGQLADGADLAIGSRKDSALVGEKQPFFRLILGKLFNAFVRVLLQSDIEDTQCGFKLLKGKLARELFASMKINGFCYDVELLYLAKKLHCRIDEVPVLWVNDTRSKVNVITDPIKMFFDLFRIKIFHG